MNVYIDIEWVTSFQWDEGCGDRLRQARKRCRWNDGKAPTLKRVAESCGITLLSIGKLERGEVQGVQKETLLKVCKTIKCGLEDIFPALLSSNPLDF